NSHSIFPGTSQGGGQTSAGMPTANLPPGQLPQSGGMAAHPMPTMPSATAQLPAGTQPVPASQLPAGAAPHGITPVAFPYGRHMGLPGAAVPDAAAVGERVPLNCQQARLDRDGQGWKLVCAGYDVARFGSSEADAKLALSAVHYYRFT